MSTAAAAAPSPTLADYFGLLKRQWLSIVGIITVGVFAAVVLLLVLPKTYLATASLYVRPLPGQGDTSVTNARVTDGVNLDTEAQLLTSSVVISRARVILGTNDSLTTLNRRVSVTIPPNSAVVDVGYLADNPRAAAAGANAFAQAYLANRKNTATSGQAALVNTLQIRLNQAVSELRDLATQLDRLSAKSAKRDLVLAQQNVLSLQIADLNDRLVTARAGDPFPGQLISPARAPTSADSPRVVLILPAGALLGLLLGLVVGVIRDRRPRRLQRASDVERLLGIPVLADLANLPDPNPVPLAEYQRVCSELLATLGHGPWSLLCAGASADDVAAPVAENVAQALDRLGGRVTLVPGVGYASPAQEGAQEPDQPSSGVRTVAVVSGAPLAEQLRTAQAGGVLDELKQTSDFVIVAGPPVVASPDAQSVAPLVDGVLLVVMLKQSPTRDARASLARLRRVNARVVGVIVMQPVPRQFRPAADQRRRPEPADAAAHDAPARSAAS